MTIATLRINLDRLPKNIMEVTRAMRASIMHAYPTMDPDRATESQIASVRELYKIRRAVVFLAQNGAGQMDVGEAINYGVIPLTPLNDHLPGQLILGGEQEIIQAVDWCLSYIED